MNNETSIPSDAFHTENHTSTIPAEPVEPGFYGAYIRFASRIAAVPPAEYRVVNLDVRAATKLARAALVRILPYRAQLAALTGFDIRHVDDLDGLAQALGHVHAMFVAAATPDEDIAAINDAAIALRDLLFTDATALAARGLIQGSRLHAFKRGIGFDVVVYDLAGLSGLLRECWPQIGSKTAVTTADLDRASLLSVQLQTAAGAKQLSPAAVAEIALERQRAFTLFVGAYDQIRRGLTYLRWDEGDVDQIAPSLYQGRGGRGKSTSTDPAAPATGTDAPAAATAANTTTAATTASAPSAVPAGPVGTPDSSPFA